MMEIEFYCAGCKYSLTAKWHRLNGKIVAGEIVIKTCPNCLEKAREEGRKEVRKEVRNDSK